MSEIAPHPDTTSFGIRAVILTRVGPYYVGAGSASQDRATVEVRGDGK